MRSRPARLALVLALALGPATLERPAGADPTREDRAAALALFDEGRKLAGEKKYPEACPKFEAAMRLDPGMGTLFNLSDCYEQIGRTASAWSGFRDVAAQAKASSQPDKEKVARDRAAALESKLSRVRLVVPAEVAAAGITITRDGSALPAALVGTPVPFDPGPHTIRVVAEGKEPWETKITVPPQGGTMDVPVPALAPKKVETSPAGSSSAAPTAAPSSSAGPAGSASASASGAAAPSPRPWQKPLGIGATVAGAAGLGVGIAFGVIAKGTVDEANKSDCDAKTDTCNPQGLQTRAKAVDQGNIGTAIGIAGAVVGAAGLALWIFAPSAPAAAPAKGAVVSNVRVGANARGIVIGGDF
jgi:hypothetical protein